MNRDDRVLPTVIGVSTLPIVLPNGELLFGRGLDRKTGIVFRVPLNLWLPRAGDCDDDTVAQAMQFLCNEWLCDVATDYAGKCVVIACALTVIERMALPERPAFFIVAGQRGGGKTTTLHMISAAVLGTKAAAASWSPNEEERRKALFAYLATGLAMLIWDNIPLGVTIGCPVYRACANNGDLFRSRAGSLGTPRSPSVYSANIHRKQRCPARRSCRLGR